MTPQLEPLWRLACQSAANASDLSTEARETARLANLWLEHPHVAQEKHDKAAAAHLVAESDFRKAGCVADAERESFRAQEHRRAADHWSLRPPLGLRKPLTLHAGLLQVAAAPVSPWSR